MQVEWSKIFFLSNGLLVEHRLFRLRHDVPDPVTIATIRHLTRLSDEYFQVDSCNRLRLAIWRQTGLCMMDYHFSCNC